MSPVIQAHGLSKQYRVGRAFGPARLTEVLVGLSRLALQKLQAKEIPANPPQEGFWALRDVSLTVNEGEVVGIIGHNGAGKSTLLKILTRIVHPTQGSFTIRGRLASLLEVGTGFHGELTGRENVFLSGCILGLSHRQVQRRFDEIVTFSGVEQFLDVPVKRYSSGMHVRLGFAVAAHLDPDVMILDEALAVGAAAFQQKCQAKIEEIRRSGRTILLVSHSMAQVVATCHRAIWLQAGQIRDAGDPDDVVQRYLSHATSGPRPDPEAAALPQNQEFCVRKLSLTQAGQTISGQTIDVARDFEVAVELEILQPAVEFAVRVLLLGADGTVIFGSESPPLSASAISPQTTGGVTCRVPGGLLSHRDYHFRIVVRNLLTGEDLAMEPALPFRGGALHQAASFAPGLIHPQLAWSWAGSRSH